MEVDFSNGSRALPSLAQSHSDAILVGTTVAGSKIQGFVERTTVVADANFMVEYDGGELVYPSLELV